MLTKINAIARTGTKFRVFVSLSTQAVGDDQSLAKVGWQIGRKVARRNPDTRLGGWSGLCRSVQRAT